VGGGRQAIWLAVAAEPMVEARFEKGVTAKLALGQRLVQSSLKRRLGALKLFVRTQQEEQLVAFFSAYKIQSSFSIGPVRPI
jgi:hypothetical protein